MLQRICSDRYIDNKSYRWTWKQPESLIDVLSPVVWNAAYVLTDVDYTRIGYCGDEDGVTWWITAAGYHRKKSDNP